MASEANASIAAASGMGDVALTAKSQELSTEEQQRSIRLFTAMAERSLKRTFTMFGEEQSLPPPVDDTIKKAYLEAKRRDRYGPLVNAERASKATKDFNESRPIMALQLYEPNTRTAGPASICKNVKISATNIDGQLGLRSTPFNQSSLSQSGESRALMPKKAVMTTKPVWHAPWKLMRVVSGHSGWVHCVDVEPGNEWMATGSADRTIKIWDMATSKLKLTLTGHVSAVKGLQISTRHPYLFSCSEDKTARCWDLEQNKVIRRYDGHSKAVNTIAVHPSMDIIATGGGDSTVYVWDIRMKTHILRFTGHKDTISSVKLQAAEPQIISSSHDSTIRFWDIRNGQTMLTLTNHKKSVRALCLHPRLYMLGSASSDNIKQWKLPKGEFVQNCGGHDAIIEALACNTDGVFVSGANNGSIHMWDWKSVHCFQELQSIAQPGSLASEAGILALTFDQSGSRLLSTGVDKTIKIYKENNEATEATHPLQWLPTIVRPTAF